MEITDALLAKLRDKYYGRLSYVHLNPDSKQGLVDLIQEEKDLEPQFVNDRPRELVQALAFYKNKKAKLELCFRSRSTGAYVAVTKEFRAKVRVKDGKVSPAGKEKTAHYAVILICPKEFAQEYVGFARRLAKEYVQSEYRRREQESREPAQAVNGFHIEASEIEAGEIEEEGEFIDLDLDDEPGSLDDELESLDENPKFHDENPASLDENPKFPDENPKSLDDDLEFLDDLEVVDAVGVQDIPQPRAAPIQEMTGKRKPETVDYKELFGDISNLPDADVHLDDDSLADLDLEDAEAEFMRRKPGEIQKKTGSGVMSDITSARKQKK